MLVCVIISPHFARPPTDFESHVNYSVALSLLFTMKILCIGY